MANLAIRSYIDYRYGLEQPQGGADFWLAFSGGQNLKRAAPGEVLLGMGLEFSPIPPAGDSK